MLLISGHSFAERPPDCWRNRGREARYNAMVSALEFAASICGEVDRSLYKSIRECQAHASNLRGRARGDSSSSVRVDQMRSGPTLPFE